MADLPSSANHLQLIRSNPEPSKSPALNGRLDNDQQLRADLQDMGVFHRQMPLYLLCRLRQYHTMGFSGYEARYFSLFENLVEDMGAAADLQVLITMLAYKYIFERKASHQSIPDNPTAESERRQFFFGTAIGIPTFYVHKNSPNLFLAKIIKAARYTRFSRRYSNYIRISGLAYRRALLRILRKDGRGLIDLLQLQEVMDDLEKRINFPREHAVGCRSSFAHARIDFRSFADCAARRPLCLGFRPPFQGAMAVCVHRALLENQRWSMAWN